MFTRKLLSNGIALATMAMSCSSTTQQKVGVPNNAAVAKVDCGGVSEQSANADVLSRPGLIEAVYEDHEKEQWGHNTVSHLRGAQILLRPEPGLSRPMLGRSLICRVTNGSAASLGASDTDPLTTGHAEVQVSETDTAYVVLVRSRHEDEAREIVRRANNLFARSIAKASSNTQSAKVSSR